MSDMGRLAQLAINPSNGASREEIYLAVASLYRLQGSRLNERERGLMRDILRRLTRDVEMAIRISVAERLADDLTAPHDLILMLADDAIEVARPLILRSPLLSEADVLDLIGRASVAHQEAVAGRPGIGEPVTDALSVSKAESVLMALVRNATAKISHAGYATLVEKSRTIAGLQEPLIGRTDLPPLLAEKMCEWVSDALKNYIKTHYRKMPAQLDAALHQAHAAIRHEPPAPPGESAMKLIDKLAASGQLKASFLMRVLSQGQVDLFDLAFARLIGVEVSHFRALFYDQGVRPVALGCRAAGIDRSVFSTVFNLSRQGRGKLTALNVADLAEVDAIFADFTRPSALKEMQTGKA